ncbi:MAG TPA: sigma-E factor regulatory protein RseB domain-containing protein [Kofleriaceae bacterium]|jgi:outer membrane lipoprotein-sorting protein
MKSATALVLALGAMGCTDVWAGNIARDVAAGLKSIDTYRGTTKEVGIDDAPVERSVVYAKPYRVRVETTTPGPHQGELFSFDGNTTTLYYPQLMFAVRIRGAHPPTDAEALHHIERLTKTDLNAYTFQLQSENARVAGQPALDWVVRPAVRAPYRMVHRVWNHAGTTLPLKMQFTGTNGAPWYSFEFTALKFGAPVDAAEFTPTLPRNTVVFDWDLDATPISLDEARATMNFPVQLPTRLPKGHEVRAIVPSEHCLPMIAVAMDHDGSQLLLIESRAAPTGTPLGISIPLGDTTATLSFLGSFTSLTWQREGTQLTLTGNLDFPAMIDIAASVK